MRLTSLDVAAEAEISYRQLDYWAKKRYIVPRVEADGTGTVREFTADEMHVAICMARLVRAGFKPARAAVVARAFTLAPAVNLGEHFQLTQTERGNTP